jgi:hypothetical protein
MSNWSVYKYNLNTLEWDYHTTVPRSNTDIEEEYLANEQKIKLADGSDAFFSPEIKYTKSQILFTWLNQTDTTLRTLIRTYIEDDEYIKITTHLSGIEYIGRFISFKDKWLVGQEDTFDCEAIFLLEA